MLSGILRFSARLAIRAVDPADPGKKMFSGARPFFGRKIELAQSSIPYDRKSASGKFKRRITDTGCLASTRTTTLSVVCSLFRYAPVSEPRCFSSAVPTGSIPVAAEAKVGEGSAPRRKTCPQVLMWSSTELPLPSASAAAVEVKFGEGFNEHGHDAPI
jgi:hypothetical protein